MARSTTWLERRKRRPQGYDPRIRVLTASARRLDLKSAQEAREMRIFRQGWQSDAWSYRDAIGELRYAINFLANCAARMRLFPAALPPSGESDDPVAIDEVDDMPPEVKMLCTEAIRDLGHGKLALKGIMKSLSSNWSVAGEGYLLGMQDAETAEETWTIRSVDEIVIREDKYQLREIPSDPHGVVPWIDLDPETTVLTRLWAPHPRYRLLADSPMRAMLDDCESLMILRRMIRATGRSRLAGAGILKVPDSLSIKTPLDDNDDPAADPFMAGLTEAMMAPISDEGSASAVVPILVRGPAEALKELQRLDMASSFGAEDAKIREELIGIIATSFDLPKEVVQGVVDLNHWPCSQDTDIWTRDGWVTHEILQPGTEVLALDPVSGCARWEAISGVRREHVVEREMVEINGRCHSSLTTPEHRWPVIRNDGFEWAQSADFENNPAGAGARFMILGAPSADIPMQAKFADAFVELCAWAITDADVTADRGFRRSLRVRQRREANFPSIRRALSGVEHSERADESADVVCWRLSAQASEELFAFGTVEGNRFTVGLETVAQFTRAQLELFLATSERANGGADGSTVFALDPARLAPVEAAALRLGYRTTLRRRQSKPHGFGKEPVWRLRWGNRTRFAPRAKHCKRVSYTGVIFCPQVPVGRSFLARRNGQSFFTGNSAWQVDDNTFRHHVEPHVIELCDTLSAAFLRPYLEEFGAPPEWVKRCVLWYDPTQLVTHPDQTKDALDLHDRFAISDDALVRIAGFTEEDRPSKAEVQIRMIEKLRNWPPNLVMAFLHAWDPTLLAPPMTGPPAIPGIGPGGVTQPEPIAPPPGRPALPSGNGGPPAPAVPAPGHDPVPAPEQPTPAPPAVTGSAARPATTRGHRLSRRLMLIDRDLRTRLREAANQAMMAQLERAGDRLRSKTAKDEHARALIANRPRWQVGAVLGSERVVALGLSPSDLLGSEWSGLRAKFYDWTGSAQEQALATALRLGEMNAEAEAAVAAKAAMADGLNTAWGLLAESMTHLSHSLLFEPEAGVPAADWAGVNPDTIVPTGIIRAALGVAGGTPVEDLAKDPGGLVDMSLGTPIGQVGTGETVMTLVEAAGGEREGYEWVASVALAPFEPHTELDDVQFASFDDEALANGGDWPDNAFFMPGDHQGCGCDFMPILLGPSEASGEGASEGDTTNEGAPE